MSLTDTLAEYRIRLNEGALDFFDEHRRRIRVAATACAILLAVGGGVYWWTNVRFRPPPSIFDSPVDDVFGYLSLSDFSKLPLDERLEFLLSLADRFRNFSQGDSAAAAAFLAGLAGPAREQATQNVRLLAKDILAQGASGYFELPEAQRGKYIDEWLLKWMKTGERITTGKEREGSDDERLKDLKDDAKRGEARRTERFGGGGDGEGPSTNTMPSLSGEGATRFLDFWGSDVESASTPREQGQIVRFLGDVRKRVLQ